MYSGDNGDSEWLIAGEGAEDSGSSVATVNAFAFTLARRAAERILAKWKQPIFLQGHLHIC